MEAIEKLTPNTTHDSPVTYEEKIKQQRIMTKAALARKKRYLSEGIDLTRMTKKVKYKLLKDDPLSNYYPKREAAVAPPAAPAASAAAPSAVTPAAPAASVAAPSAVTPAAAGKPLTPEEKAELEGYKRKYSGGLL